MQPHYRHCFVLFLLFVLFCFVLFCLFVCFLFVFFSSPIENYDRRPSSWRLQHDSMPRRFVVLYCAMFSCSFLSFPFLSFPFLSFPSLPFLPFLPFLPSLPSFPSLPSSLSSSSIFSSSLLFFSFFLLRWKFVSGKFLNIQCVVSLQHDCEYSSTNSTFAKTGVTSMCCCCVVVLLCCCVVVLLWCAKSIPCSGHIGCKSFWGSRQQARR